MFSRPPGFRLLAVAILLLLAACGGQAEKNAAPKSLEEHFAIQVGDRTVQVQVAAQRAEMQNGLMHRKSLGADEGMLFVFSRPQQLGFWMHNTEIDLDIGYFDAGGELKEIYRMYAHDEKTVSSHARNLQFALEMNQGWYGRTGVKPGAKIDLKAVAEALRARGLKPEAAGLR